MCIRDRAWCMSQGEGEDSIFTIRERQEVSSGIWKLFTTVQRGENGTPISRVCETYEQGRSGNLCTSRIEAYGTDYARETTYAYNAVGKLIRETAPDGSEKTWSYDAFGRETVRMEPWAGGGRKGTYTYYRCSDPVSYTHLDVYKRQTMSWVYWEPKSMTATRCLSSM